MLKDNLKTLRKNKGLSQEELSIKLNVVRQTISKWETGLSVPDAEMLITISEFFETPVSDILGESIEEKETNDIKIISNPEYITNLKSEEYTYSFSNFIDLTTYTIIASKLQKRSLSENIYRFRILNVKSPYISELNKYIYLNISINGTEYNIAQCPVINKTNYAMECSISDISYIPFDIIFPENTIETSFSLFEHTTTFFENFNGKRTLTVKPGILNRGKCVTTEDNINIYYFNITDCEFYYNYTGRNPVKFNLSLDFDGVQKNANCNINLSGIDTNTINCSLEVDCPDSVRIRQSC